jgi:hypothetical protein
MRQIRRPTKGDVYQSSSLSLCAGKVRDRVRIGLPMLSLVAFAEQRALIAKQRLTSEHGYVWESCKWFMSSNRILTSGSR